MSVLMLAQMSVFVHNGPPKSFCRSLLSSCQIVRFLDVLREEMEKNHPFPSDNMHIKLQISAVSSQNLNVAVRGKT